MEILKPPPPPPPPNRLVIDGYCKKVDLSFLSFFGNEAKTSKLTFSEMKEIMEIRKSIKETCKTNSADTLPPVGCNLAIIIDGRPVTAKRTGYIASRGDMLEYELLDGSIISGRFEWRYL